MLVNQPGAGGALAARAAAAAVPDGHTLYMAVASTFTSLPLTQRNLAINVDELVPIGFVGEVPIAIGVSPSLPVNSLPELVALSKRHPGKFNVGFGIPGGVTHLTAELLRQRSGADLTTVPYPGSAQATADAVSGRISGFRRRPRGPYHGRATEADRHRSAATCFHASRHRDCGGNDSGVRRNRLVCPCGASAHARIDRGEVEQRPAHCIGQCGGEAAIERIECFNANNVGGRTGRLHSQRTDTVEAGDQSTRPCQAVTSARAALEPPAEHGDLPYHREKNDDRRFPRTSLHAARADGASDGTKAPSGSMRTAIPTTGSILCWPTFLRMCG